YALGWNRHAIRKEEVALVVEGYMDVVALAASGFDHAVAALGTAITDEHARLLSRYTKKALLLFDSDDAGNRAAFRAADALLAHGVQPSVVTLPPGEDPDSLVRSDGPEALQGHLDAAVDVLDRKLQLLEGKGYFASPERVRAAVDKLLPTLRAVRDPTLRDIYLALVARRTGVRVETLEEEMSRGGHLHASGVAPAVARSGGAREGQQGRRSGRMQLEGLGAERQFVLVLLRDRRLVERALERIGPGEFRDPAYRAIFEALADHPDLETLPEGAAVDAQARFEALMRDPEDVEHTERTFEETMSELEDRTLRERQAAMTEEIRRAASEDEKWRLTRELDVLRRERAARWHSGRIRRGSPVGMDGDEPRMSE
ncbi:MAG: toprim domain-containing protein, partial [Gemmatimonadota bacterium]